ncbi:MAG: hypothetical protein AAFP19_17995 [Bacteroidota bacterium]
MTALYELLSSLPSSFEPSFAPRLNKLYLFLINHPGLNPKEAAAAYLGSVGRLKYFNKLRLELKKALIRYLIANPSFSNNKDLTYYEDCYRDFAIYKILLLNGKRNAGIELAKDLLPRLQKFELHGMIHILANDLMFHYSIISVSKILAKKYARLAQIELEIVKSESLVREYHSKIGAIRNTRESFTQSMIDEFIEAVEVTEPLLKMGIHHINRLIYTIIVSRYAIVYDYENIIHYCKQAIESFPDDHRNIRSLRFIFIYNMLPALLATGKLRKAKQFAKDACGMTPKSSFNWHIILIKRIIICFHAGDYQEAYDLYKAHQKQKCTFPIVSEYWQIIRGYLCFLIQAGKVDAYTEERFQLGKFLNDMPIYSRDKAGNNINILIIQILIRMQRGQYGFIIDRIESLREYARKYMRNTETKRANIFINMILRMEAAQFHRFRTEGKTRKLLEKLLETPLHLGQNLAIEMIPYELLWEEMLEMLDNKFRGATISKRPTSQA